MADGLWSGTHRTDAATAMRLMRARAPASVLTAPALVFPVLL